MNAKYAQLAFDVIDEFDQLESADAVLARMSTALSVFGFTSFSILTAPELIGNAQPCFFLNGWPKGWADAYAGENYYRDDPVAAHVRHTVDPFEWSEVVYGKGRLPRANEVMSVAADFGLKRGFVIPVMRSDGAVAAVTMAGERPEFATHAKRALHLIGLYAHAKAASLVNPETLSARRILTAGEREVLTWIAAGKSTPDISVILAISEPTVKWRLKNACSKLDAVTRTQAVVNALRAKEISI